MCQLAVIAPPIKEISTQGHILNGKQQWSDELYWSAQKMSATDVHPSYVFLLNPIKTFT